MSNNNEISLRENIELILNTEPYLFDQAIDDNHLELTKLKILENIDSPFFDSINNLVPCHHAKEIVNVLFDYYANKFIEKDLKPTRKINKDKRTIQEFINLLSNNYIYNNDLERNYTNKSTDKAVYDYCQKLLDDLETKRFKESLIYSSSEFEYTKSDTKKLFNSLRKIYKITTLDVTQFINMI